MLSTRAFMGLGSLCEKCVLHFVLVSGLMIARARRVVGSNISRRGLDGSAVGSAASIWIGRDHRRRCFELRPRMELRLARTKHYELRRMMRNLVGACSCGRKRDGAAEMPIHPQLARLLSYFGSRS